MVCIGSTSAVEGIMPIHKVNLKDDIKKLVTFKSVYCTILINEIVWPVFERRYLKMETHKILPLNTFERYQKNCTESQFFKEETLPRMPSIALPAVRRWLLKASNWNNSGG